MNEVKVSGGVTHEFSGTAVDQNFPSNSYNRDSNWEGDFAVTDRVHLTSRIFMDALATFQIPFSIDHIYSGDTVTQQYPFHVVPTLDFGYLQSKQFLLKAFVTYNRYTISGSDNVDANTFQSLHSVTTAGLNFILEF